MGEIWSQAPFDLPLADLIIMQEMCLTASTVTVRLVSMIIEIYDQRILLVPS
jgi:hypothetical protein